MTTQRQRTMRYTITRNGGKVATFQPGYEHELAMLLALLECEEHGSIHTVTAGYNAKTYWTILEPGDRLIDDPEEECNWTMAYEALCARIQKGTHNES